jgi:glycosyltransferase involved in cell wall biosynthesis
MGGDRPRNQAIEEYNSVKPGGSMSAAPLGQTLGKRRVASCDVLLAAYNGSVFGPALLDSLLAQTDQRFRLLVRDDGSADGTLDMIEAYAPRFGGRIRVIESGRPTGSAQGNFSLLLEASDADYVLCADIDDVWLPTKVAHTLALLQDAEATLPPHTPVYVFTDVVPVNADLVPLSTSFWKYKKINPLISQSLNRSLVCPSMLGCASGMNRALVDLITPIPSEATGHDWWALLVAILFGAVGYSHQQTMLYRQHGNNASAQKRRGILDLVRTNNRLRIVSHGMRRRMDQAQALLNRFGDRMDPEKRRILANFVDIGLQSFVQRRVSLLKYRYLYPDFARNVAMLVGV